MRACYFWALCHALYSSRAPPASLESPQSKSSGLGPSFGGLTRSTHVCLYVCVYVSMSEWTCICTFARMYACMCHAYKHVGRDSKSPWVHMYVWCFWLPWDWYQVLSPSATTRQAPRRGICYKNWHAARMSLPPPPYLYRVLKALVRLDLLWLWGRARSSERPPPPILPLQE